MNLFARFRRNRTLVFGVVATLALVVSAVLAFDFRAGDIFAFLWQCVLLVVAIILSAAVAFALLQGARALWRRFV